MKKLSKILGIVLCLAMVLSLIPAVFAEGNSATLSFASTDNRTSLSTTQQVWTQNGITVTNDKGDSPSDVANYSNPVRFYKNSKVTIAYPNMTSIVIDCNGDNSIPEKNIKAWSNSITANSNYNVSVANKKVTITFNTAVNSFEVILTDNQARAHSITVTYGASSGGGSGSGSGATNPGTSTPSGFDPTGKSQDEIIDAAYNLGVGESMTAPATLTGVISAINTEWSDQYNNITVTIKCAGKEDKPIMCFRLKGDGAKDLKVTDTITVKGTIKNYNGTVEFDAGCTLQSVTPGTGPSVPPYDPTGKTQNEIIDAAYELEVGVSMAAPATLTGVISAIDTEWSDQYNNITVTIKCAGKEDKPIQCFRLAGEGAKNLKVGDTVTVKGTIKNYNSTIEFVAGCELLNVVPGNPDQTGDTTAILAVTTIMVLSVAVLAVLVIGKKRMF